jgi:Peptidase family S41
MLQEKDTKPRESRTSVAGKAAKTTKRRTFHSRSGGRLPDSAAYIEAADEAVRPLLASSTTVGAFLGQSDELTARERLLFVEQAIVLLESFYVHLPLKRAMHAIDPLQRLRLLRKRLPEIGNDARFHAEMTSIFTSLRDLHTNYLLPEPFSGAVASLPFRIEFCTVSGERSYLVTKLATGFQHPTFKEGVELRYWNGTPIARAVANAADRHAGSNLEARHARGLAGMTQRPLVVAPLPDEEWVIIGYKALDGTDQEIRLDWLISGLPAEVGMAAGDTSVALGVDLETELVQSARRILFAPETQTQKARIEAAGGDAIGAVQGTESIMPEVFTAREVTTSHGKFGHIRIWKFSVPDADAFVQEFIRLAELLPQEGLIVDVRDNGGGLIYAGEQLLQIFTPRTIEPERLQFINTGLTQTLCELHAPSEVLDDFDLSAWLPSIRRALETGATFSAGFPITPPDKCNAIGQRYCGPVVLITNARCYSTTDIFAAGFQDHDIGPIIGVDGNTGAGGANVWEHNLLQHLFSKPGQPGKPLPGSPFKVLPKGGRLRVAIRRTLRVGPQAGTELEDLGVVPDHRHELTRNDLLNHNADLFEKAGSLLAGMPLYRLSVNVTAKPDDKLDVEVSCRNLDRIDCYLDGKPQRSERVDPEKNKLQLDLSKKGGMVLLLQGYQEGKLGASRRIMLA